MKAWILILVMVLIAVDAHSSINIKSVELKKVNDEKSVAIIQYEGVMAATPELNVAPRMIQVVFPESTAWPKIEKQADLIGRLDTTLMAYQYDKNTVRFRILLPYASEKYQTATAINLKGQTVEVEFKHPKMNDQEVSVAPLKNANAPQPIAKAAPATTLNLQKSVDKIEQQEEKKEKVEYDEKYLSELLNDKSETADVKNEFLTDFPDKKSNLKLLSKLGEKKDQVTVKQSADALAESGEAKSGGFSLSKYIGKFVAFLSLILLGFFAIVHFFKKGVLRKGKFSFLKNNDLVTVLSTTYLAPKRSLMVVKAYNQVLLLGSSENGIHFLGEIDDLSGVLKQGEQEIAGNNFDTRLDQEVKKSNSAKNQNDQADSHIKIKENITISHNNALDKFLSNTKKNTKAVYKEKIQEKVKGLKSLQ